MVEKQLWLVLRAAVFMGDGSGIHQSYAVELTSDPKEVIAERHEHILYKDCPETSGWGWHSVQVHNLSKPWPEERASEAHVQIGGYVPAYEWYDFEDGCELFLMRDGTVWSKVANSIEDIPEVSE